MFKNVPNTTCADLWLEVLHQRTCQEHVLTNFHITNTVAVYLYQFMLLENKGETQKGEKHTYRNDFPMLRIVQTDLHNSMIRNGLCGARTRMGHNLARERSATTTEPRSRRNCPSSQTPVDPAPVPWPIQFPVPLSPHHWMKTNQQRFHQLTILLWFRTYSSVLFPHHDIPHLRNLPWEHRSSSEEPVVSFECVVWTSLRIYERTLAYLQLHQNLLFLRLCF